MPPKANTPILSSGFEKHAQTAIQVILVGITMWVGSAIITLRDSSIRLEENHKQTQQALVDIKGEVAALRSIIAVAGEQRVDLMQRLTSLEFRVEALEKAITRRRQPSE